MSNLKRDNYIVRVPQTSQTCCWHQICPLCGSGYVLPLRCGALQCRYLTGYTQTDVTHIITCIQHTTETVEQKTLPPSLPPSTVLTCSFGFPARKGVIQLSPLGLSQGLVYTIPYITQQVWSTYTTKTPTIRVVNDVFRNMMLLLLLLLLALCRCVVASSPSASWAAGPYVCRWRDHKWRVSVQSGDNSLLSSLFFFFFLQ